MLHRARGKNPSARGPSGSLQRERKSEGTTSVQLLSVRGENYRTNRKVTLRTYRPDFEPEFVLLANEMLTFKGFRRPTTARIAMPHVHHIDIAIISTEMEVAGAQTVYVLQVRAPPPLGS